MSFHPQPGGWSNKPAHNRHRHRQNDKYPGDHGDEPDIISYAADGQPGGESINADILSWKSQ